MKRLLLILIITCSVLSLSNGQDITHVLSDFGFDMTATEYLRLKNRKEAIVGSPYLSEDFEPGKLKLKDTWYEDVDLRYDIYSDYFEVKLETGTLVIDPLKNDIDSIVYKGELFIRMVSTSGKNIEISYMPFLGSANSYLIYKQYQIIVSEAKAPAGYSDAKPAEFRPDSPDYYIFKGNNKWQVSGTKSIAEIFNTENKVVKKFLKEKRLKLKREEELIQVIEHFSTI